MVDRIDKLRLLVLKTVVEGTTVIFLWFRFRH